MKKSLKNILLSLIAIFTLASCGNKSSSQTLAPHSLEAFISEVPEKNHLVFLSTRLETRVTPDSTITNIANTKFSHYRSHTSGSTMIHTNIGTNATSTFDYFLEKDGDKYYRYDKPNKNWVKKDVTNENIEFLPYFINFKLEQFTEIETGKFECKPEFLNIYNFDNMIIEVQENSKKIIVNANKNIDNTAITYQDRFELVVKTDIDLPRV